MRVRLVCYEDVNGWILGKFALRMEEHLSKLGVDVDIAKTPSADADINHHIIYVNYEGKRTGIDTVMVTHVDECHKMDLLVKQAGNGAFCVCMSKHVQATLVEAGISRELTCVINPAHDHIMVPRKIVLGLTTNMYPDGRKRTHFIEKAAEKISSDIFAFHIMGSGWEPVINKLKARGFTVQHWPEFNLETYKQIVPNFDYYLYTGMDEGSMGFLDALAAGVSTIVTPQGYHLDVENGIDLPFTTQQELTQTLLNMQAKRLEKLSFIEPWTWKNYAQKHLILWRYLLENESKPTAQELASICIDTPLSQTTSYKLPSRTLSNIKSSLIYLRAVMVQIKRDFIPW